MDHLQNRTQSADFLGLQQIHTTTGRIPDSSLCQSTLVIRTCRTGRTQKNHNILGFDPTQGISIPNKTFPQHGLNMPCDKGGFFRISLFLHIHTTQFSIRLLERNMADSLIKRFFGAIVHTAHFRTHAGFEHIITSLKHTTAGSEIAAENDLTVLPRLRFVRRLEFVIFIKENRWIRQAELIDGLLHITDHEKVTSFNGKRMIDLVLYFVGILVLVHHNFQEASADFFRRRGQLNTVFPQQQIQHFMFQIAKIQNAAALFRFTVGCIKFLYQRSQASDRIGRRTQILHNTV